MTKEETLRLKEFCLLNNFNFYEDHDGWLHITVQNSDISFKCVLSSEHVKNYTLKMTTKMIKDLFVTEYNKIALAKWNSLKTPDEG